MEGRNTFQVGKGTVGSKEDAMEYFKRYLSNQEKELMQQIEVGRATPTKTEYDGVTYSDIDLEIGGEYHKFIYDKVVTDQAKKIGKKHGAKVEEGGIARTRNLEVKEYGKDKFPNWDNVFVVWDKTLDGPIQSANADQHRKYFRTKEEAIKAKDEILNKEADKVWTMKLTDKLKQASKDGLPYYMVLPPLVIGGAAAQRTDAQKQQSKTDAQSILAQ